MNKFGEVKDILGASCNKEIIRKKKYKEGSKVRVERIKDWPRKS